MTPSSLTRRHWIGAGLATCGYLAARSAYADQAAPVGYTKPAPVKRFGLAPGLQHRVISTGSQGEKTYAVIFSRGDEVISGLTEFAEREKIQAAHLSAIGGFQHALFGWFDEEQKAFRNIPVDRQVEVCSLMGDIGIADAKPQIHIHGVVGSPTGDTKGGHLLEAYVGPTLELFVTTWPDALIKKHEAATGLSLFDLHAAD